MLVPDRGCGGSTTPGEGRRRCLKPARPSNLATGGLGERGTSVRKFEGSSRGKLNTAWVLRETVRGYGDDGEWAEGAKMTGSGGSVDRSSAGLSPQNPTLAYYVHKTDEDRDKVTDQVTAFDYDEWKNSQRFQELTSLERLALVLFVLPADAFKKYRRTGKLNVFGADLPTFKHSENLDHYRPVPLHLSVVTDEHPSITSLFA